jgi:predicted amidophosphoribosyltransferase
MKCVNCQKPLEENFKVCPFCGTDVSQNRTCPSCQKETDPSWVVCPYCSTKLNSSAILQQRHSHHSVDSVLGHRLHGSYSSSNRNKHKRRKGFLGSLFSS